jgi:tetratricopeptide (TPR) repeat protein
LHQNRGHVTHNKEKKKGLSMSEQTKGTVVSIEEATKLAHTLYEKGKLDQSIELIEKVLSKTPKNAMALHLLGVIKFGQGAAEEGISRVSTAVQLLPQNALFAANLTEMLRKSGNLAEAEAVGRRAIKAGPKNASAHSNLGIVLYDLKKLDQAEAYHLQTLALDPKMVGSLNNLGSIARERGNLIEAERYYKAALSANPQNFESANNLASVLIEAEQLKEARAVLVSLLRIKPDYAEAHRNMGRIFLNTTELDLAEFAFRKSLEFNPQLQEAYIGLSQVMYEKHQNTLALEAANFAYNLAPDESGVLHQLALCEADSGNSEKAILLYNRALEIKPDFAPSLMALGHLKMEVGDMDRATDYFKAALEAGTERLSPLMALSRLTKMTEDSPIFIELEAESKNIEASPPKKRIAYHYAMGKAFEDIKNYNMAFNNFARGAEIKRGTVKYDPDKTDQRTDQIIKAFTPKRIAQMRKASIDTAQPIFVLGMPRSGTTLTESILASHSQVFGAGELPDLLNLFPSSPDGPVLGGIEDMKKEELTRRITDYARQVDSRAPGMHRITDKMPANFQMIGVIHSLLPNAKIIHVMRNPMDTCLSCFTRLFERSQLQSYDQVELGRYYLNYRRLVVHWSEVLPQHAFMELKYEDLVDDIEAQTRRMLSFCGLEWEAGCLEFHNDTRRVRTASVSQVRQPVYKSSVEKWRAYEAHLGPLINTIKQHL